jgi:DNA-binding IclR family transcriptional regulator
MMASHNEHARTPNFKTDTAYLGSFDGCITSGNARGTTVCYPVPKPVGGNSVARERSAVASTTKHKTLNYATPALDKGLDVLELLAHQPLGLTKSQIARGLDRTVSEIFRMLVCLERRGYIAQLSDESYSLTLKLFKLVQEHPPTERIIADALPVMHRLSQVTMQSCHMGVLDGGRVAIVAQVNAPLNLGFYVKLGSTVDLMESASGYVILAHQNLEEHERSLGEWSRSTGIKPPRDLATHLARIKNAGYEKRASYLVKGIVNISFPIFDERASAVGALTVPYIQLHGSSTPVALVIEALRKAAAEITGALGGATPSIGAAKHVRRALST